jgi:2-amino-4-hydroxy-6-hydroxymethyldihydropteridine diphosphokinase
MYTYYLSLGTNLGDKEGNLRQAIQLIEERIGAIASLSAFYVSEPWGFQSENSFLNACCGVNSVLAPNALREEIDINACDMASLYHDHFNSPKYKFKVYKK